MIPELGDGSTVMPLVQCDLQRPSERASIAVWLQTRLPADRQGAA